MQSILDKKQHNQLNYLPKRLSPYKLPEQNIKKYNENSFCKRLCFQNQESFKEMHKTFYKNLLNQFRATRDKWINQPSHQKVKSQTPYKHRLDDQNEDDNSFILLDRQAPIEESSPLRIKDLEKRISFKEGGTNNCSSNLEFKSTPYINKAFEILDQDNKFQFQMDNYYIDYVMKQFHSKKFLQQKKKLQQLTTQQNMQKLPTIYQQKSSYMQQKKNFSFIKLQQSQQQPQPHFAPINNSQNISVTEISEHNDNKLRFSYIQVPASIKKQLRQTNNLSKSQNQSIKPRKF